MREYETEVQDALLQVTNPEPVTFKYMNAFGQPFTYYGKSTIPGTLVSVIFTLNDEKVI